MFHRREAVVPEHDFVPDAETIRLHREGSTRAGAFDRAFVRFDANLPTQTRAGAATRLRVDGAWMRPSPKPGGSGRTDETADDPHPMRAGGTPEGRPEARARRIDREGQRIVERGGERTLFGRRAIRGWVAVPVFGHKGHIGIARAHDLVRRFAMARAMRRGGGRPDAAPNGGDTAGDARADAAHRGEADPARARRSRRARGGAESGRGPGAPRPTGGPCRRTWPAATRRGRIAG